MNPPFNPNVQPPELTPEHAYTRALAVALMQTLSPKKGERMLKCMFEQLSGEITRTSAAPIRGDRDRTKRDHAAIMEASRALEADIVALLLAARR